MCCATHLYPPSFNVYTSYIYQAPKNTLIIMAPSDVHESGSASFTERLVTLIVKQKEQFSGSDFDSELFKEWRVHHNRASHYEVALDGKVKLIPDVGVYFHGQGVFFIEVVFKQGLEDLLEKVGYKARRRACCGVLGS